MSAEIAAAPTHAPSHSVLMLHTTEGGRARFASKRRKAEALGAHADDSKELESIDVRGRKGGEDAS